MQLLFQARKTRSSYVKEALKHVKNIQVVPGEVYQGGILSLFLFSKRGSITESSDNISVPVNDPRRSIHGDVWNRLLVHLYTKLRQISESSYIAAKVIFLNRVYMSLLTHSPLENFAENHVLKLVEPFSGHCQAIKSEKLPQNRLQVVHFAAFWSSLLIKRQNIVRVYAESLQNFETDYSRSSRFSCLISVGNVFVKAFRILGLDERKGRWVVEQDFRGNCRVKATWFLSYSPTSLLNHANSGMVWKISSPCTS